MSKFLKATIILSGCFIVCLAILVAQFFNKRGEVIETWSVKNTDVEIRITVFSERYSFVPGAYYVFESITDKRTQKIMTFRHDDPISIEKDKIVFMNDKIIYLYTGWVFATSIDGGNTWTIWDAASQLSNWTCCNYYYIKKVKLAQNGTGEMFVARSKSGKQVTAKTTDFGKTWTGFE